ncbi:unnamed protein product [Rotaria sp. Silwood1]|nr:unnamed protein product [Rotaria sp. Silwood1]CAF0855009.1 unnamed protein product [Rotaria sp. Silwood1]CAF0870506.1 unnamed protein product [Rotaria sp. Silwood1]
MGLDSESTIEEHEIASTATKHAHHHTHYHDHHATSEQEKYMNHDRILTLYTVLPESSVKVEQSSLLSTNRSYL